jgi:phage terminase large subunit-like protein
VRPLFGWKRRADGLRRYRFVYCEIGKKNGKSTFAGGLSLALLLIDGEMGAEVYSLARSREQAGIVFRPAADMCGGNPELAARAEVLKKSIYVASTLSIYQVLSADVPTKEGLNPHAIIFDEMHVQDDRRLWDTVTTGLGARRQPVTIALTTAGFNKKTLCGEIHDKAIAVRDGVIKDETFLPVVYAIEKGEDWEDRKVWARVNPNLGVSPKMEYLEQKYKEAKDSPAFENTFRRYYLNEWVQQAIRWINQKKWASCAGPVPWNEMAERLRGRPCFGGLDLSTVTDLSALVLLFDSTIEPDSKDYPTEEEFETAMKIAAALAAAGGGPGKADDAGADQVLAVTQGFEYGDPMPAYDALSFFWCPAEGIHLRSRKDRVPYELWRDQGAIVATPGDAVDHGFIRKRVNDLAAMFHLQELAVDPHNAHKLITELAEDDGIPVIRQPQGFGAMSAPCKALDVLYRRRQIRHGGHPVLSWNADNAVLDKDAYDNWKLSKRRSTERIDGMVALVMALARAQLSTGRIEDARIQTL